MIPIVMSPFSNGDIRDWPAGHFSDLIGLLLNRIDAQVRVVGARSQATRAAAIVRPYDATKVISDCGRPLQDVIAEIRQAGCVIGNNSGITHLSAWFGIPTICLFGGSHQRLEWRPMGPAVRTISRVIGCAPCQLHRARDCAYGKACLDQISPELVADIIVGMAQQKQREEMAVDA